MQAASYMTPDVSVRARGVRQAGANTVGVTRRRPLIGLMERAVVLDNMD